MSRVLTSSRRENLPFVLPRYPYVEEPSLFELLPRYSWALLTGFCPIETREWVDEPEDEITEDLEAMSVSTDHDDDSHSCRSRSLSPRFDTLVDASPVLHEEPSDDSDDNPTFHHGCDKHFFIDKDLQPNAACVFVMDQQRNIYHALSSALYHRRALGIREPMIGLTFGDHGSYLHLILAWLEEDVACLDQTLVSLSSCYLLTSCPEFHHLFSLSFILCILHSKQTRQSRMACSTCAIRYQQSILPACYSLSPRIFHA